MKSHNYMLSALIILFTASCGTVLGKVEGTSSYLNSDESRVPFTSLFENNSDRSFDLLSSEGNLTVTNTYLHIPSNNMFGNRYVVLDLEVQNLGFEKVIEVGIDSKWSTTTFTTVPSKEADGSGLNPTNGLSYIRYTGSAGSIDRFSILAHKIIFSNDPTIEIRIHQANQSQYAKIKLRQADMVFDKIIDFSVQNAREEIGVRKISSVKVSGKTFFKIDLETKKFDDRRLFQVECTMCASPDQLPKTLRVVPQAEVRSADGAVLNSSNSETEMVSLHFSFSTSVDASNSLTITYVAGGYFGTPTHGVYDGIYGNRYSTKVSLRL